MTKKQNEKNLFEYRIRYNAGTDHCFLDSYHYYMAETANQAFSFHQNMMKSKNLHCQNISIEKYNKYSEKWEDETSLLKKIMKDL